MVNEILELEAIPVTQSEVNAVMEAEVARKIQEVQASLIIAQRFPRNEDQAVERILKDCERVTLAEQAFYTFPRGETTIIGPSIRLAETLARRWGHMHCEVSEVSQGDGFSEVMAKAWDLQTGFYQIKTFRSSHYRVTKKGMYKLRDPRDIYEKVANEGARRLRACILGVIPGDIVEAAQDACRATLQRAGGNIPIRDRVEKMLMAFFDEFGVSRAMIEALLKHNAEAVSEVELVRLRGIFKALRDGQAQVETYFVIDGTLPQAGEENDKTIAGQSTTPVAEGGTVVPAGAEPAKEPPKEKAKRGANKPKDDKGKEPPKQENTGGDPAPTTSTPIATSEQAEPPPPPLPAAGGELDISWANDD